MTNSARGGRRALPNRNNFDPFAPSCSGIPLALSVSMDRKITGNVIYAAAIFRCSHPYMAALGRGVPMFTCTECGYQTDELPLRTGRAKPATTLVSMPLRQRVRRHSVA